MEEALKSKQHIGRIILRLLLRLLAFALSTLAVLAVLVLCAILIICRGGSDSARDTFVRSVKETSAVGFLADLFLSSSEVEAILNPPVETLAEKTDASLVAVARPEELGGPEPDAWGYVDEDGDGLILVPIKGGSYTGFMLIVLDPSRVVVGCHPGSFGGRGYTVAEFAEEANAAAAINAGGFEDEGGMGNGSVPDTLVVSGGEIYCSSLGLGSGFAGLDADHVLHVGIRTLAELREARIQEGCGFVHGPVLVVNGEIASGGYLFSGLNPRTAIGQRSDGAILLLVLDGRQPSKLGASYLDEAELMLRFGAVNASNLDGGSSSLMWFNGSYVNENASLIGIRPVPTAFLVLQEGRDPDA